MEKNLATEYYFPNKFFGVYPAKDKICVFTGVPGKEHARPPVAGRIDAGMSHRAG